MGAPASQTVTQEVDPWIRSGIQGLYSQANQYLNQTPYQAYPGSTVAGFQPFQNAAASFLSQGLLGQPLGFSTPPTYGPFGYNPFQYQMPTYSPYSGGVSGGTGTTGGSGGVGQPYTPDEGEGGGTNGVAMAQMQPAPPISIGDPTRGAYTASLGGWGRTGPYAPLPGRTDELVPTEDELTPQQPTPPPTFQLNTTRPDAVTLDQSLMPTGPLSGFDKTYDEIPTFIPTAPPTPPAPPEQSDYDKTFGETDTFIPSQPLDQPPLYPGATNPSWSGAVQPLGAPMPGTYGGMYGGGIGPMSGQAEGLAAAQRARELMGYTPDRVSFGDYSAREIAQRQNPLLSQQVGLLDGYDASQMADLEGYDAQQLATPTGYDPSEIARLREYQARQLTDVPGYAARELDDPLTPYQANTLGPVNDSYNASQMGPLGEYDPREVESQREYSAAQLDPLQAYDPSTVSAQTGAGMMDAYVNPYEDAVVSQGIEDLNRARQIAGERTYESAGRGTYGSDRSALLEAENTRNYLDQVSRFSNQMRSAGFDRAAGLAQQDAARALQASGMNQQAINAAQQFGLGQQMQTGLANQAALNRAAEFGGSQGLQAALANQGAYNAAQQFGLGQQMQTGLANQAALNRAAEFGQSENLQRALADQAAINDASRFGYSQQMQRGLANQAAVNRASEFNQAQGLERGLANQSAYNQAQQFGLNQEMQRQLANQAALNRGLEFGGSQGLQAALANQQAYNQAQQFGLGQAMQTGLANQQALNAASQFNQQQDLTRLLSNQGAADAMTRFGATQDLQTALANQQAMNQMGQFNAQGALQAALANQSAGLSGAGMNLNAAQALSGIGSQNLQNLLSGTNALMGMGGFAQNQAQQMINADIARYDQARNDPLRRFGLLQSIIGGMPISMNTTQTMQPNIGSQLGGGLLGLLGAAGSAGGFGSLFG